MAYKAYQQTQDVMEVAIQEFPDALDFAKFMQDNGVLSFPHWCYLPHDVIRGFLQKTTTVPNQQFETVRLGVSLSWWQHKAVYRFNAPVLKQIISRPEPIAILENSFVQDLPQWGGYVDMLNANHDLYEGFWWHFDAEGDFNQDPTWEPRLVLFPIVRGEGLTAMYLKMGTTVREMARQFIQEGLQRADTLAVTIPVEMGAVDGVVNMLNPIINILLYLLEQKTLGPVVKRMPAAKVNVIEVG